MSIYVFLGPTLPTAQARQILDAEYLPPAAMGDVYNLMAKRPRAIAIIDGYFEQVPSIWHKEILHALELGVRVFGASSMGALRAAELHTFGMEGVGRIFDWFASGTIEDDDEVAVIHAAADQGYQPLSEPMVNVRDALLRARDAGVITEAARERVQVIAKSIFYAERSWSAIYREALRQGIDSGEIDRLAGYVQQERPNLKRDDAVSLLERIGKEVEQGLRRHQPTFRTEQTAFWQAMTESVARPHQDVSAEALRNHLLAIAPNYDEVKRGALLMLLVEREAARTGRRVSAERLQRASARFRRARNLGSVSATEAWMADNHLDKAEFTRLIEREAVYEDLSESLESVLRPLLPIELRRRSEFIGMLKATQDKARLLQEKGIKNPTLAETGVDDNTILRWYEEHCRLIEGSLEEHAKALGFTSARVFLSEVLAQYLLEKSREAAPVPDRSGEMK